MTTQKNKIIIGIVVFAVLVAGYFVIAQQAKIQKVDVAPEETTVKEISCDIGIFNPRGLPLVKNGDLNIESVNCQQQFVKNCGRFGLFSDKGSLRLEAMGGLGNVVDVAVSEGSSQSYTLNWCGSKLTKDFKVTLLNSNNEIIQERDVKLI